MGAVKRLVLPALLIFSVAGLSAVCSAKTLGPYSGTVLDARTGEPVEGASVFFYWTKSVPEMPHARTETIGAELVCTDGEGGYQIPGFSPNLGLMARFESTKVIIYQPGYRAYIKELDYLNPYSKPDPSFKEKGYLVKLDRLPPNFSHEDHTEVIERALWGIREYPSSFKLPDPKGIAEKKKFLERVEWEERRAELERLDESTWKTRKKKVKPTEDKELIEGLIRDLKQKDPWKRLNAVYLLGETGSEKAAGPLLSILGEDPDWRAKFVQQEAVIAIRKIWKNMDYGNKKEATLTLIAKSHDAYLRLEVLKALGEFRSFHALDLFFDATGDPNEDIRRFAVKALTTPHFTEIKDNHVAGHGKWKYKDKILEAFARLLKDPFAEVRAASARGLGELKDPRALEPLIKALQDSEESVQSAALKALARLGEIGAFGALADYIVGTHGGQQELAREQFGVLAAKTAVKEVHVKNFTNLVNRPAVTALLGVLGKGNDRARAAVVRLLGSFEDDRIDGALSKFLDDPSPEVRKWAGYSFGRRKSADAVPILIAKLEDEDPYVRREAVSSLGRFKDKRAFEPLIQRLEDSDGMVRASALDSLGEFDDPRVADLVVKSLKDENPHVRASAAFIIIKKPDRRAVEPLIELLGDRDYMVPRVAASALGAIGDQKAVKPLISALKGELNKNRHLSGDMSLRRSAAKALGLIGDKRALPALVKVASNRDEEGYLRRLAASALGEIGDPSALEVLEPMLKEKGFVKTEIKKAIKKLKDKMDSGP